MLAVDFRLCRHAGGNDESDEGSLVTHSRGLSRAVRRSISGYLSSLAELWRGDLEGVAVAVNRRFVTTVAAFRPKTETIELSARVLSMPLIKRREVICHEAAHALVWRRHHARAMPHGPQWRALVRAAGFSPAPSTIRCRTRPPARPKGRFRHTCQVCQFSSVARREMPLWRCPECRALGLLGMLNIERIR
jgi:predicted SprT family Zn-dependent metalloprotease